MQFRTIIALFLVAIVTTLSVTRSSAVMAQSTIPMLTGTTQPINVTLGDQTNPHVACNIASYTNDDFAGDSFIRYFDFATNTEYIIPGNGLDRLANTDGQHIAFTQLDATGDHVLLYDLASQTTTQISGSGNFATAAAVGGNLVAYQHGDFTNASTFEINTYDINTRTTTQLTNDTLTDQLPAVSPDGNVVVWEKCQQPGGTGCNIYSATHTGSGAFTVQQLTSTGHDRFPKTNGQIVVYVSDKSGENDVYFQRLGSSTEMHLSLPGDQRDVSISGNLIAFESGSPLNYDIFLYDLSSARLYQVTNTPDVNETLTDVVAGCNGVNRIIYAKAGGFGDFDVWGFNFQLSDSTVAELTDLVGLVQSFNLHDGTEASLLTKLQDAIAAVNASDTATACDSLTAFINATQAQSGKKLTAAQVNQLVAAAAQIKSDLGCQ